MVSSRRMMFTKMGRVFRRCLGCSLDEKFGVLPAIDCCYEMPVVRRGGRRCSVENNAAEVQRLSNVSYRSISLGGGTGKLLALVVGTSGLRKGMA